MTISEAARQSGVNVETIRFYERSGFLDQPQKPPSGYRRYTRQHVNDIRFIKQCQSFGFSLEEASILKRMLETGDASCDPACTLARRKLDQIQAKIEELTLLAAKISVLLKDPCVGRTNQTCSVMESLRQGALEATPAPTLATPTLATPTQLLPASRSEHPPARAR